MKIRERDGTVRAMTQEEISEREAAHQEILVKAKAVNDARSAAVAKLKERGSGAILREEFEELKEAVAKLLGVESVDEQR